MHDADESKPTARDWAACESVELAHNRMLQVTGVLACATVCICLQRNASSDADEHLGGQGPRR